MYTRYVGYGMYVSGMSTTLQLRNEGIADLI